MSEKRPVWLLIHHRYTLQILIAAAGITMILIGSIFQYAYTPSLWMTYRDFDTPGEKNFINYLSPGVKDVSSGTAYDFSRKKYTLLWGVLLGFFPLMFFFRVIKDLDFKYRIFRFLTQWITFVIARLGIFRVAGICPAKRSGLGVFPFLNCQSCELATGACPLGTFQMSMLQGTVPFALIGKIILTGLFTGRLVCGWLCPYGFLSDIFNKLSGKRKIKIPVRLTLSKYIILGLLVGTGIFYFFHQDTQSFVYCTFICPAGFYYGVLEYALTTGFHSIIAQWPYLHWMLFYHFLMGGAVILGSIKLGGRFFCKFLCPLGAVYGLFNRVSFFRMELNANKCIGCKQCEKVCPMDISILDRSLLSRSNCIMCMRCKKVCPTKKIDFKVGFPLKEKKSAPAKIRPGVKSGQPPRVHIKLN